jgi:hypothetical protein
MAPNPTDFMPRGCVQRGASGRGPGWVHPNFYTLGSYEPFHAVGAGTFDRRPPIERNQNDLSNFLKNDTTFPLARQEIVDFS